MWNTSCSLWKTQGSVKDTLSKAAKHRLTENDFNMVAIDKRSNSFRYSGRVEGKSCKGMIERRLGRCCQSWWQRWWQRRNLRWRQRYCWRWLPQSSSSALRPPLRIRTPGQEHHQHDHHNHHRHPNDQYDYYSNNPASENSVDIAAPIVSALQAAPTEAQVIMIMTMMMMTMMTSIMMTMVMTMTRMMMI